MPGKIGRITGFFEPVGVDEAGRIVLGILKDGLEESLGIRERHVASPWPEGAPR